ncbi:MAG: hypothetical protein P8M18_01420 [Woeseiaceae bacterium]|nr:hypothetical protein [Woeseiaceae bacterium]
MRTVILIVVSIVLAACSTGESDEVTVRTGMDGESETVAAKVSNDYNNSTNRARNFEVQFDAYERSLDAAIEKQADPDR